MTLQQVLGAAGAAASPGAVADLAARLGTLGEQAQEASALLASRGALEWAGQAADRFSAQLSELPSDLGKAARSFRAASVTLWTYQHALDELLAEARGVAGQLDDLDSQLAAERRMLASTPANDPHHPGLAVRLHALEGEREDVERRSAALRARLDEAASTCVAGLRSASDAGIRNSRLRGFEQLVHTAWSSAVGGISSIGKTIGKLVIDPFVDLADAVVGYLRHPSWETFATVLRAGAAVAGEVALAVGVVALFATGAGELLAGAALLAGGAATALSVGTVAADDVALMKHETTPGRVEADSVGALLSVASGGLGRAADRAAEKSLAERGLAEKVPVSGSLTTRVSAEFRQRVADTAEEQSVRGAELDDLLSMHRDYPGLSGWTPIITHVRTYVDLDNRLVGPEYVTLTVAHHVAEVADHGYDLGDRLHEAAGADGSSAHR